MLNILMRLKIIKGVMMGKKLVLFLFVIFLLALPLAACGKPLTLTVTQPMDGATVTEYQIYVKGKVSSHKTVVTVNNVRAWIGKTGEFQGTVTLAEGENTIRVVAKLGKKEVNKTVTVTYTPSQ